MRIESLGLTLVAAGLLLVPGTDAQVVREADATSIAGLLSGSSDVDQFTFEGRANQILFATIDSSIYQNHGRNPGQSGGGGCEEGASTTADTEGESCSFPDEGGSCSHDSSGGGCSGSEGGPLHIKLELLNSAGGRVCHAGRPNFPGWQRDPRMICALDYEDDYTLRIMVSGMGNEGSPPDSTVAIPYLLNVSLRTIAPSGSLEAARQLSKNEF